MKNLTFINIWIAILLTSKIGLAQGTVSIAGSASVEVGLPYQYTFTFTPNYEAAYDSNGNIPNTFIIYGWTITTNTTHYGKNIKGYIGDVNNQSTYYYAQKNNSSTTDVIDFQWGDDTDLRNEVINVKVEGMYSGNGAAAKYFSLTTSQNVTVQRIYPPNIIGPSNTIDCDQTTATYNFTNTTFANQFLWSVNNGAQIIGSNTGTTISVKPPLNGNFDVICSAKRSGANPYYVVNSTKTVSRTPRTVSYKTYPLNKNCIPKGTGLVFQIDNQVNMSSVIWNAPDCTVSNETILNGVRQVTIVPNNYVLDGTNIKISADVVFWGGCSTQTQSKSFVVGLPQNLTITATWQKAIVNSTKLQNLQSDVMPQNPDLLTFNVAYIPGVIYQWKINGIIQPAVGFNNECKISAPVCNPYQPTQTSYTAEVTMSNDCGITINCRKFIFYCNPSPYIVPTLNCNSSPSPIPLPIPEEIVVNPSENFIISPNPSSDLLTVSQKENNPINSEQAISNQSKKPFSLKFYDANGSILKKGESKIGDNLTIDVSSVPNGTYYLHIQQGENLIKKQVVINH